MGQSLGWDWWALLLWLQRKLKKWAQPHHVSDGVMLEFRAMQEKRFYKVPIADLFKCSDFCK